ncbi:MAG: hypothetical protein N2663_08380 [Chlorobi bacterium]|nr:hypothetical protein [Chlorobiota bacterium]
MPVFQSASHYCVIECTGNDSVDFLQRMTTGNITSLKSGEYLRTALVTEKGRLVDVLTVLRNDTRNWLLLCTASQAEAIYRWFRKYIIMDDVQLRFAQEYHSVELWFIGDSVLNGHRFLPSSNHVLEFELATYKSIAAIVSQSPDHWDVPCIVVTVLSNLTKEKHDDFTRAIAAPSLDDEQRHCLRVHAGIGCAPNEYNDRYTPNDAGLNAYLHLGKGCFIGQEVIERLTVQQKSRWKLYSISTDQAGYDELRSTPELFTNSDRDPVGHVTSVAPPCTMFVPSWLDYRGLAYVASSIGTPEQLHTQNGVPVYLRCAIRYEQ